MTTTEPVAARLHRNPRPDAVKPAALWGPRHVRRRRRRPGMLHACFVRSPFAGPASAASTSAALALPGVQAVFIAPTSTRACTSRGTRRWARTSRTRRARRWPRARSGSSATRWRSSSPTTGTSPRTPSTWWTSTTSRCRGRSTTRPPERRGAGARGAIPENVAGEIGGPVAESWRRCSTSAAHDVRETIHPAGVRRSRWRPAGWWPSGPARS